MGTVVISVDAELAWGLHDQYPLKETQQRRVSRAREMWLELLDIFERYDVPATWAVVGTVLVADTTDYRENHPLGDDWFRTARREIERRPQHWNGEDLVESITAATVDHEIASHSFSHVVFTEVSREVARTECELATQVCAEYRSDIESFVFPRNAISHRDVVSECGFTCYRGGRPATSPGLPGLEGAQKLTGYLTRKNPLPLVEPTVDEFGLINVPASMFLGGYRGKLWSSIAAVHREPAVTLAQLGIDSALRDDGVFHLWLHPNDLTNDRYVDRVESVVSSVAERRRENGLTVETMETVADRVRSENL